MANWDSTISYNDFVAAVQNAYKGNSSLTWSQVSQSLANAGCTTDNYLNYLDEFPNAVDVVKNANGSIRAVRTNPYASIFSDSTWDSAISGGSYNSNLMPPSTSPSTTAVVSVPGTPVIEEGTKRLTFKQGMSNAGNFVFKEVAPAVMAAGLGIKLGKVIDGAIYNIGTAMGLDPPWALNPETWDSITSGSDDPASRLFNTVFGIDNDGNAQMYADGDTIGLLAQWMALQDYFNVSSQGTLVNPEEYGLVAPVTGTKVKSVPNTLPYSDAKGYAYMAPYNKAYKDERYGTCQYYILSSQPIDGVAFILKEFIYVYSKNSAGSTRMYYDNILGDGSLGSSAHNWVGAGNEAKRVNNIVIYNLYSRVMWADFSHSLELTPINSANENKQDKVAYALLFGETDFSSDAPDGVTNQKDANLPNTSNWNDPTSTLESLKEQYPDWFANPLTNDVVQPDGSVTTYNYYPIGFPMPDGSTGTQTQNDTQVQPSVSPQPLVDYLLDILNPPTDVTPNPPDTGEGNTPPVIIPIGSASSLWAVYNPTQEQLNSFGSWLWSSDLVEQIKKLFSNPMESIIGVHKVFAQPKVAGQSTIKCGYIDSGVTSNYITDQYVQIDCGNILLTEYFGNVFDYDPYTRISLFLPFIGIVPLNISDVMRGKISVKYNIDVITGACLAEVQIIRDGVGGIIYTFSGSCIVSYPLSSGSYAGIIGGILGIAGGVIGSIASGGTLAPLALGAMSSISHLHTNVQKSGSFSGAPGAMGGKTPYLIVTRPQTRMADNYLLYDGVGSNYTTQLSLCKGYTKVKEVHLKVPNAYESELKEIESLLHEGILI